MSNNKNKVKGKIDELSDNLARDNIDKAEENYKWLELYEKSILIKNKNNLRTKSLYMILLIAAVIFFLSYFKVNEIDFVAEFYVDSVKLESYEKHCSSFFGSESGNFSSVKLSGLDYLGKHSSKMMRGRISQNLHKGRSYDLISDGTSISIECEDLLNSVKYKISSDQNVISILLPIKTLYGTLSANEVIECYYHDDIFEENGKDCLKGQDKQVLYFGKYGSESDQRVNIHVKGADNYKISNMPVSKIFFEQDKAPGSLGIQSSLNKGKIKFPSLKKESIYLEGELLKIECIECELISMDKEENQLKVNVKGSVKAIASGATSYNDNVMPSYSEFLYYNNELSLIMVVFMVLWGWLWKFVNLKDD